MACSRVRENRNAYRSLVGKPKGKRPVERLRVDGKIISKLILKKQDRTV
jgi:hypothetical protein